MNASELLELLKTHPNTKPSYVKAADSGSYPGLRAWDPHKFLTSKNVGDVRLHPLDHAYSNPPKEVIINHMREKLKWKLKEPELNKVEQDINLFLSDPKKHEKLGVELLKLNFDFANFLYDMPYSMQEYLYSSDSGDPDEQIGSLTEIYKADENLCINMAKYAQDQYNINIWYNLLDRVKNPSEKFLTKLQSIIEPRLQDFITPGKIKHYPDVIQTVCIRIDPDYIKNFSYIGPIAFQEIIKQDIDKAYDLLWLQSEDPYKTLDFIDQKYLLFIPILKKDPLRIMELEPYIIDDKTYDFIQSDEFKKLADELRPGELKILDQVRRIKYLRDQALEAD